MHHLTETPEWKALAEHYQTICDQRMTDWFSADKERFSQYSLAVNDILLDYSRNRVTNESLMLLRQLAHRAGLKDKINDLMQGMPINVTERRPALHTALRDIQHTPLRVNGENIATSISACLQKMAEFTACIHQGKWRGVTGKPITHVVNVGIGGSHLGPKMTIAALNAFTISSLHFDFISSIDDSHLHEIFAQYPAEQTLFIVSSKSFTTIETMTNALTIKQWLENTLGTKAPDHHLIAVTAAPDKALAFGILPANIFPMWEWIGGRYSVWSAVGLPLMLSIGSEQFHSFLTGAHEMDKHFQTADFASNMPVILALLDIWYTNFFGVAAKAIIPYSHQLRLLIPYLQQAEMESNGKRVNIAGDHLPHATAPILFGEEGCDGQHTYHQLLHQGTQFVSVDFILVGNRQQKWTSHHHDILLASCFSQAQALLQGKTWEEAYQSLLSRYSDEVAQALASHLVIPGNRPSNILYLQQLTPKSLGSLIALYEHKIFTQGIIWQINSFDQWGVELGKQLLPTILKEIQSLAKLSDSPNSGLIKHVIKTRELS